MLRPKHNGMILYDGPSMIDGKPIIAIATGFRDPSKNFKTGPMIQTWILRKDVDPQEALNTKKDVSVCGNCKHRGKACYVLVYQAPSNVWKGFRNNSYPPFSPDKLSWLGGRNIRIGSYGDPAAVPIDIWTSLISKSRGYTGYTHQWKSCDPSFKKFCMASVDSVDETLQARAEGWRTFRVRGEGDKVNKGEIVCPASGEGGHKTQCINCKLCSGTKSKAKDISTIAHGAANKKHAFKLEMLEMVNQGVKND